MLHTRDCGDVYVDVSVRRRCCTRVIAAVQVSRVGWELIITHARGSGGATDETNILQFTLSSKC